MTNAEIHRAYYMARKLVAPPVAAQMVAAVTGITPSDVLTAVETVNFGR